MNPREHSAVMEAEEALGVAQLQQRHECVGAEAAIGQDEIPGFKGVQPAWL